MLAGLAPSSQTVGSLIRTPQPTNPHGKILQKVSGKIHFNRKIRSTTFDRTNLAFSLFEKVGFYQRFEQGSLTEREGSVQLTSLYKIV